MLKLIVPITYAGIVPLSFLGIHIDQCKSDHSKVLSEAMAKRKFTNKTNCGLIHSLGILAIIFDVTLCKSMSSCLGNDINLF